MIGLKQAPPIKALALAFALGNYVVGSVPAHDLADARQTIASRGSLCAREILRKHARSSSLDGRDCHTFGQACKERGVREPRDRRRRHASWSRVCFAAGTAEDAGDDLGARARRALSSVRSRGGALTTAIGDRLAGTAPSTADRQLHSDSRTLAFGTVLKPTRGPAKGDESVVEKTQLQVENDASVAAVLAVIDSDGWEFVTERAGVTVVKKFMPAPAGAASSSSQDEGVVDAAKAAKFACVKAMGTLDAEAADLFKLFLDNERVHEFNDNCQELRDLERLSSNTKVSWAATPRYGPFRARDFVTIVHYRTLEDGTMIVLNRAVEHKAARRGSKYVRAEILIATNIMRPNREDPSKTDFISVTHINPGGIVDTKIGAKIANKLCAKAPVNLLVALERCANSSPTRKSARLPVS